VIDPLEKQGRQFLGARKFRNARDSFKLLCKKDRAKYLPLLIEANVGLVQEMLDKGLVSEAQQVVVYLKTIAPKGLVQGLEAQLAAKSGDGTQLAPIALKFLTESEGSLSPAQTIYWADRLVTAFAPVPADTAAGTQIAFEVQSIHEALKAIAAGQNDAAREWVRPLAHGSVFRHWTFFVKALAAFHSGDDRKAVLYFSELPADSVPGRAREPYLLALGTAEVGNREWPEPVIEVTARLAGCAHWGRLLSRAQSEWRAQRYVESYQVVRDGLSDFPRESLDAAGVLSEFFFNAIFSLTGEGRDECEDFFLSMEMDEAHRNAVELKWIRRTFCLLLGRRLPCDQLKVKWEAFLHDHQHLHGDNPRLASLGYGWLGEELSHATFSETFSEMFGNRSRWEMRDAPGAIHALQKSIALDPDNLAAHLKLLEVYTVEKMTSERSRLLDVMTARFPDRKQVLMLAGAACLDCKAYPKGVEYLEEALRLDRIDPVIPDLIVRGLVLLAQQDYEKGRAVLARQTMSRVEEFLNTHPENFLRNSWCHLARRGLLEQLHGDVAQGTELLARAHAASPFPAAFLCFARLAWQFYADGPGPAAPFKTNFDATRADPPTVACALVLVRIWLFWLDSLNCPSLQAEKDWMCRYLDAAISKPFSREEAAALVELIQPREEFQKEAAALVKKVLKQDKLDPLFCLYQRDLQPFHLSDPDRDREAVEAILHEATRRGDGKAVQRAREVLGSLDSLPAPMEDDAAEFDDAVAEVPMDFPLPPMSCEDAAAMEGILAFLAALSEKDLKRVRKNPPKGIPVEFVETLISMARNGLPFPPLGPLLSQAVAREAGPAPDPKQLNLL
jgi:tetratricopeptide (TPR) repeat protein